MIMKGETWMATIKLSFVTKMSGSHLHDLKPHKIHFVRYKEDLFFEKKNCKGPNLLEDLQDSFLHRITSTTIISKFHIEQEEYKGSVTLKRAVPSDLIWNKFHASHWNSFLSFFLLANGWYDTYSYTTYSLITYFKWHMMVSHVSM